MLKRELPRYIVTGILAVLTDFSLYFLLQGSLDYSLAKGTSFTAGASVAFILNRLWTFKQNHSAVKQVTKFSLLYTSTLVANVTVNKLSITLLPEYITLAFLFATATSTILNFLGNKFIVFTHEIKKFK